MSQFQKRIKTGEVSRSNIREVIQLSGKNKPGRPTYLSPDKEAFVIAAAEIEVAHGFTI